MLYPSLYSQAPLDYRLILPIFDLWKLNHVFKNLLCLLLSLSIYDYEIHPYLSRGNYWSLLFSSLVYDSIIYPGLLFEITWHIVLLAVLCTMLLCTCIF